MKEHFDKYLNVKKLLLENPPKHILELGALHGENTIALLSLCAEIPDLRVTVITDGLPDDPKPTDPALRFIWGVSWVEMQKIPDRVIGCVIIDTDHNYYTMMKELSEVDRILTDPGWVMFHDTLTYDTASGHDVRFRCGYPYPLEAIEHFERMGLGMGDAIRDFMTHHRIYREVARSDENHGALAIRRMGDRQKDPERIA